MKLFMSIIMIVAVLGVQGTYTYQSECLLPVDPGLCRAYFHRYYYNTQTRTCGHFIYGGCGGNKNNFGSLQQCKENCRCFFPAVLGPCRAYFPRYYYDYKSSTCKKFIYGGCRGNENSFESFQECMYNCGI